MLVSCIGSSSSVILFSSLNDTRKGNYGRLPRILFYCTIIFGVLASQNEWLIAGALAAALTYSGTAAIHTCILVWRGPLYGELDFYAMLAILSTSCAAIVPLLNWSDTIRDLGFRDDRKGGSRTLIIYWGCLVTVGLLSALSPVTSLPINFSDLQSMTCALKAMMNETVDIGCDLLEPLLYAEWISQNGCADPGEASAGLPKAIFRAESDLQMLTRIENAGIDAVWNVSFLVTYCHVGIILAGFCLLQGAWAVFLGRKTPRQSRYVVYSFLKTALLPILFFRTREQWYKHIARLIAILVYLWEVITGVVCVLLFILSIAAIEYLLFYLPQSETTIHVGAWSSWSSTGLLILAAFISKHHEHGLALFYTSLKQVKHNLPFVTRRKTGPQAIKLEQMNQAFLDVLCNLRRKVSCSCMHGARDF